jgi:hypothetical protein
MFKGIFILILSGDLCVDLEKMSIKKEDSGIWGGFRWVRIGFILVNWLARCQEFSLHKGWNS